MIVERVIGRAADFADVDPVDIDWQQTVRRAMRLTSRAGRRVSVLLPPGHATLRDGDVLLVDGATAVALRVRPLPLLRLRPATLDQMGLLCADLGNRHVPVEVVDGTAIALDDGPVREVADKLGVPCEAFVGAFHPLYVQPDVFIASSTRSTFGR